MVSLDLKVCFRLYFENVNLGDFAGPYIVAIPQETVRSVWLPTIQYLARHFPVVNRFYAIFWKL